MSTELATGWIRLVPSSEGIQGNLVSEMTGAGSAAGLAGGAMAGGRFAGSFKKMLGAAALTGAVVGAFKGLYSVGTTWEDVTNSIQVSTGAQGDALDGLVSDTKSVAKAIPADIADVGDAIAALNGHTDASGQVLQGLTTSVLEASRVLGEDGTTNADNFGTALRQWQRPAEDGEQILDALFKGTQDYGIGLDSTIGYLKNYGATLNNAGFSMEESAALFGMLEQGGIQVTRVMPGLNSAFRSWAGEGKNVQEELYRTVDAIADAETSSEGLAIATEEFGAEGAQRLTTAIRSGHFEIQDLEEALQGADGIINQTAESTMTFSDHWQVMKNNGSAAIEPLATTLVESLGGALSTVTPMLTSMAGFLADNEWVLGTLAALIGTTVVAAMVAWTASVWASTVALLANPVTWVIVGIVALIAAIVALVQNWDTVVTFLKGVWASVVDWVKSMISGFADWWRSTWSSITEFLTSVIDTALEFFKGLLDGAVSWVTGLIDGFRSWWFGLWASIGAFLTSMIQSAIATFRAVISSGVSFVQGLVSGFLGFWSGIWSSVGSFLTSIISGAMNFFRSIISGGIAFGRSIINGYLSFWIGVWGSVLSFLTGIGSSILSFLTSTWSNLYNTATTWIGNLLSYVGDLPSKIIGIFGNAGSWLLDAGKQIISGFIDGIKGAFGGVQDALGGLTDLLPSWKGPPERDEVLLRGAGNLVIGGFTAGLEEEYGSVEDSLGRFTAGLSSSVNVPAGEKVEPGPGANNGGTPPREGPLVQVDRMIVDSDRRVKQVAQELHTRASRADRSKGDVKLQGATA